MAILIESKADSAFIRYPSKIKSKEKSLTTLIHKATEQLYKAKEIITNEKEIIDDEDFLLCSRHINMIERICLISDAFLINRSSLEESLSAFKREDIPIIISIEALVDMLIKCHSPNQFCKSLFSFRLQAQHKEELPIVTEVEL